MSIEADIDRAVGSFVEDLADLVRRAALEAVREAIGSSGAAKPAAPRPAKPARAVTAEKPAAPVRLVPPPEPRVTRVEPTILPPVRRKLDRQRRGRLVVLPPTHATSRRAAEGPAAEAKPATPPEPIPARNWVVVRRPAKNAPSVPPPENATAGEPPQASEPAEATPPPAAESA